MLSVYSRHYPPCPSEDINYRRCRCPKWINGVLGSEGPFIRRGAKTRSWERGEQFKRKLEAEYQATQNVGREGLITEPEKVILKDAVSRFLSSKRNARRLPLAGIRIPQLQVSAESAKITHVFVETATDRHRQVVVVKQRAAVLISDPKHIRGRLEIPSE